MFENLLDATYPIAWITSCLLIIQVLSRRESNRFSTWVFSGYILLQTLSNLLFIIVDRGLILDVWYLYRVTAPLSFLIPPMSYLYVRSIIKDDTRFRRSDVKHFILSGLVLIHYLPYFLMSKDEKIAHIREVVENYSINLLGKEGFLPEDVISLVRASQFLIYIWLHWSLISKSGLLNKEIRTSFERRIRFWLIAFTIAVTAFYLPLAFAIMMYLVADAFSVLESSLGTILVIQWWTGWFIMPSYIFFSGYLLIYPEVNLGKMTVISRNTGSSSIQQASDQDDIELLNKLLAKEKVWLDPELNIYALSKLSGLSTRRTSYLLNNYYNENFNSVVNRCRIEYAIEKIKKGYLNQFTTDSLWKECGFSNQSTFFSSFKKITGSTPVEYSKVIHSPNKD